MLWIGSPRPLRWVNRRRQWAAGVQWARCRHRGRREGPAWGTHSSASGETSLAGSLNCQWPTTTTASHCKGQRRCQYLSRCEAVTGPWISSHTDACIIRVMLAWARDGTDFGPSINGVGGACASRRTVWESGRERLRNGAGVYPTSVFRPPRSLHAYWHGRTTRPIFDHR